MLHKETAALLWPGCPLSTFNINQLISLFNPKHEGIQLKDLFICLADVYNFAGDNEKDFQELVTNLLQALQDGYQRNLSDEVPRLRFLFMYLRHANSFTLNKLYHIKIIMRHEQPHIVAPLVDNDCTPAQLKIIENHLFNEASNPEARIYELRNFEITINLFYLFLLAKKSNSFASLPNEVLYCIAAHTRDKRYITYPQAITHIYSLFKPNNEANYPPALESKFKKNRV